MEVFAATPHKNMPGEIDRIKLLFDLGLMTLHVRKSKFSDEAVEEYIRSIPSKYHSRIIIHGHYNLVRKFGLKGYCIKRRHRSNKRKNRLKRLYLKLRHPKKVVCASFNSIHSFRDCDKSNFDFVIMSNLMTILPGKKFTQSSTKVIKSTVGKSPVPVIAQGGITSSVTESIKEAGFHGVILSSAVFDSDETLCIEQYSAFTGI